MKNKIFAYLFVIVGIGFGFYFINLKTQTKNLPQNHSPLSNLGLTQQDRSAANDTKVEANNDQIVITTPDETPKETNTKKHAPVKQSWINDKDLGKVELLFRGRVPSSLDQSTYYDQQVLKTDTSHKLLIRQSIWNTSGKSKAYLGEQLLVADHLLIKLRPKASVKEFKNFLEANDFKIKDQIKTFGIFIVQFEVTNFDTINKSQKKLSSYDDVETVAADVYYTKIN